MKIYFNVCNNVENLKKTKTLYIFEKTLSLPIVYSKCGHENKENKSIIKKKKKRWLKTVLLAKSKLNSIGALISKALIDSNIVHDEFALKSNVLKELSDGRS